MGFVLLGVFAWNALALQGVVLQIVCHAFSTGALFILVGGAAGPHPHARHGRDGRALGRWRPAMGGFGDVLRHGLAGPARAGQLRRRVPDPARRLAGEHWAAVLGAVGLVFATVYALWMMQRAFQGEETHGLRVRRPRRSVELGMFAGMIAALVLLGFCPQPLITTARQTVDGLQQLTARSALGAAAAGRRRPPRTRPAAAHASRPVADDGGTP